MIRTQLSTNSSNKAIIESSSKNIHKLESKISRDLSMYFLAAREIVRDKELSIANNRILTILSRNSKETRTFYKPKRKRDKHLSILVLIAIETWLGISIISSDHCQTKYYMHISKFIKINLR